MNRKTPAQVANINARAALGSIRTRWGAAATLKKWLTDPGHAIEPGTVEAYGEAMYRIGWKLGVRDANGEDD